jgi:hypothetical protein
MRSGQAEAVLAPVMVVLAVGCVRLWREQT